MSFDLFPTPFAVDGFPPPLPLPPLCPNFPQVGINATKLFPNSGEDGTAKAFAFYIWNNITANITDTSGNLVQFVPGETVAVTINASADGASFIYNSTVQGVIEVDLEGEYVWGMCHGALEVYL